MKRQIILASKSPRRLDILRSHGYEPIVLPADADETLPDGIDMESAVRILALKKARACYEKVSGKEEYAGCIIIGADTIVYKDEIMGKPENREDAFRMLDSIRNTFHYVSTGVAMIDVDTGEETVTNDVTKVYCKNYSDQDIEDYLDTDEPYDKAGAYAIQGLFGKHIDHFDGDYENVVGLPFYAIDKFLTLV